MRRLILGLAASFLLVLAAACSGEGAIGDDCDTSGTKDGECESGSICGDRGDGSLGCLKLCVDQTQCAATESCNGISGSSEKGCRTVK